MSRTRARRIDPIKQLERLEHRHQKLSLRVDEYEARLTLTRDEEQVLATLKKQKLAAKDAIHELRAEM